MTVEFISLTFPNPSTELAPLPDPQIDLEYLIRYARAVEDAGFDYTLVPYVSSSFDPFTVAAVISQHTSRLRPIVALRPNTAYPTVAAKALATLDQVSGGRAVVHLIAGGSDEDQAREGDFLSKDQRYARTREYVGILRRAWASDDSFDHDGAFYRFRDFRNAVRPVNGTIPVSVGGSSDEAYAVGGELGDIFGLWGEPLAETREQIERVATAARAAGRAEAPRIWTTFRPIIAPTEAEAWEKADRVLSALERNAARGVSTRGTAKPDERRAQNVGTQRLRRIAETGDRHDRALWTAPSRVSSARGATTALVGTPETVAAAILDYVDLGVSLVSLRGYDNLDDVVDCGRYVLPLVREELARRSPSVAAAGDASRR